MKKIANGLTALVALEHIWFLIVEMFLWTKPIGMKMFALEPDFAQQTATLAANQGLYNGFLAAGLIWSLLSNNSFDLKVFFLSCVVVAGVFGAATVSTSILIVQGGPALLALAFVYLSRKA